MRDLANLSDWSKTSDRFLFIPAPPCSTHEKGRRKRKEETGKKEGEGSK
jgi:hypothetical protein